MMAFRTCFIFVFVFLFPALLSISGTEGSVIGRCFDTWSRCSGWSSGATGILWQSCDDRCKCKGRSGGRCVLTTSQCPELSSHAYQCQCYGSYGRKTSWWCGF